MNQALTKVRLNTFDQQLVVERTRAGLSHREVATRVGVSKEQVRAWETGVALPNRFQLKKLIGSLRRLGHFVHLLPNDLRNQVTEDAREDGTDLGAQLAPVDVAQVPQTMRTFGAALEAARTLEGLDLEEVASLCGVVRNSVYEWEKGWTNPVAENYAKLLTLFPALQHAPKPEVRAIDKPVGNRGGDDRQMRIAIADEPAPPQTLKPQTFEPEPTIILAPASSATSSAAPSKLSLITWGRLVFALFSAPNHGQVLTLLKTARESGLSLDDVIQALEQP